MAQLKKGILASFLGIGKNLLEKSVGLISTLVLARVLVPEDFGLVATATIFMGFVQLITNTGGQDYVIKAKTVNDDMLNTNWTINFILKALVATITIFSAHAVAGHFGDLRLVDILYFYAFATLLGSLNNPGLALLRREHNVLPIIINQLIGKIIAVITAVTIALIYETYWALIIGQFISQFSRLIGSYIISSYRPWFCLKNTKHQFNFSVWLVAQSCLGYGRTQIDSFLVASNFSQSQLGQYNIMKYIAFLPNVLVLGPATGPLFRQLSTIKDAQEHFKISFNVATLIGMCIAFPIAGIMYISGVQFVDLLLGKQWHEYASIFTIFAFLIPPYIMYHQSMRILKIFDNTKGIFQFELISFILIYSCLYMVGLDDLMLFAIAKVILEISFSFSFLCFAMTKYTGFKNFIRLIALTLPILFFNVTISYILAPMNFSQNSFLHLVITTLLYSSFVVLMILIYVWAFKNHSSELRALHNYLISGSKMICTKIYPESKIIK